MSLADISALGNLQSAEPLDLSLYPDAKESIDLPKKGTYTVQAPPSFPPEMFGASQAGFLTSRVDPTVLGPTNEGFTVKFTKVSSKTWKDKNGLTVSQLGRYLKATGLNETIPADPQDQADAVASTAGAVYKAQLDWRAYCKGCGFQVEGEEKFFSDGNGGHKPYTICPNCKDEQGEPLGLRANVVVSRFLSA